MIKPKVGQNYLNHVNDLVEIKNIQKDQIVLFNHTIQATMYIKPEKLVLKEEVKKLKPKQPKVLKYRGPRY